jgi:O-antigen ligase
MKDYMIIGKGMNGEYYFPMQEQVMEDVTETAVVYRRIIENGYLQLLLTGGIVHIVLFVLILLPASLLGMFQSSNQFTKACGAAIFLWILDMLIYGLPRLSLHYILVWICVGICYKQTMRSMTNSEIESEFEKVKLI